MHMYMMASSSSDEEQLDQVDLFHVKREKATLSEYGEGGSLLTSASDEENDDEVMSLGLTSSDEEAEPEGEAVALKAWGKRKTNYYAEDGDSEGEDELEEREAIHIQQQFASALSEVDYEVECGDDNKISDIDEAENELVPRDLSLMDEDKRLALMSRQHPELLQLLKSLKNSLSCLLKNACVVDGCTREMEKFLETNIHLNFCYSLNVMYYLLLKADSLPVNSHPVTGTLVQLTKLMGKLRVLEKRRLFQLTSVNSCEPQQLIQHPIDKDHSNCQEEDPLSFYHRVGAEKKRERSSKSEKSVQISSDELEPVKGKRAITYQIARNKGVGLKTKRQLRNPRVKHKLKYKKALHKRKSQVLPVVKELTKYGGEATGIKSNLARSTKILC